MTSNLEIIVRRVLRQRQAQSTEAGRKVMALLGESVDEFRRRSRDDRASIVRRIARRLALELRAEQQIEHVVHPALDTAVIDPAATIALS